MRIRLTGRTQYQYVCENSSSSCSVCTDLHGKHFDLQEAQAGHNLPPMHPNCRCTIEEYPPLPELPDILDVLDLTLIGKLLGDLEIALQRMALDLDNGAEGIGAIWSYFFGKSFHDFYGTFTTIELGGVEYRINKNTFSAVAIGPDGNFVVPENVSAADAKLLELMKQSYLNL